MFEGAEVGLVHHAVGIDDAHNADVVEVETFADHLRADEDVGTSCSEVGDDAFVGIARAGGVEVHTCNAGLRKNLAHLFLYLLRTKTTRTQVGTATTGTLRRNTVGKTTVVACQLVQLSVERQRYVAMLAGGHPATLVAFDDRRKTATILE